MSTPTQAAISFFKPPSGCTHAGTRGPVLASPPPSILPTGSVAVEFVPTRVLKRGSKNAPKGRKHAVVNPLRLLHYSQTEKGTIAQSRETNTGTRGNSTPPQHGTSAGHRSERHPLTPPVTSAALFSLGWCLLTPPGRERL